MAEEQANVEPLSSGQERRLVDYIEDQFLTISGQYKKRIHPSTTLPTLQSYLTATRTLLSMIMLIPPLGSSASLRVTFLLRFTGEVLDSIAGYPSDPSQPLLDYLDDLDKAWIATLQSQIWDIPTSSGKDLILPSTYPPTLLPISVSQTDRTRLRSILLLGTQKLEDWLPNLEENEAIDSTLENLDQQNQFNDMFHRTLVEMGELS